MGPDPARGHEQAPPAQHDHRRHRQSADSEAHHPERPRADFEQRDLDRGPVDAPGERQEQQQEFAGRLVAPSAVRWVGQGIGPRGGVGRGARPYRMGTGGRRTGRE